MTDNEIITIDEAIKILELNVICSPKATDFKEAVTVVTGEINRQKAENEKNENIIRFADKTIEKQSAEIERLQKAIKVQDIMIEQQDYKIKTAKSEARKEFVNLIKRRLNCNTPRGAYLINIVDNLVKEMEDKNG